MYINRGNVMLLDSAHFARNAHNVLAQLSVCSFKHHSTVNVLCKRLCYAFPSPSTTAIAATRHAGIVHVCVHVGVSYERITYYGAARCYRCGKWRCEQLDDDNGIRFAHRWCAAYHSRPVLFPDLKLRRAIRMRTKGALAVWDGQCS